MRAATIIDVVRGGRAYALAVGELVPGLLEVVDVGTGAAWGGALSRDETALARERLDLAARLQRALHDDVSGAEVPVVAREPADWVMG